MDISLYFAMTSFSVCQQLNFESIVVGLPETTFFSTLFYFHLFLHSRSLLSKNKSQTWPTLPIAPGYLSDRTHRTSQVKIRVGLPLSERLLTLTAKRLLKIRLRHISSTCFSFYLYGTATQLTTTKVSLRVKLRYKEFKKIEPKTSLNQNLSEPLRFIMQRSL